MTARNEQIGTVPCPYPGCAITCPLFKYTPRADGRRSAFTGKWYATCIDHGRIDGASGARTQDYLLEKGEVWGARKAGEGEPERPVIPAGKLESGPPVPKPENPEPAPVPKPAPNPEKTKQGRGFLDF